MPRGNIGMAMVIVRAYRSGSLNHHREFCVTALCTIGNV